MEKNGLIPEAHLLVQGIHKPVHNFLQRPPVVRSPVMGLAPSNDNVKQERNPSKSNGGAKKQVEFKDLLLIKLQP